MNRPHLVSFSAITNDDRTWVKAHISDSHEVIAGKQPESKMTRPIQSIGLLRKKTYQMNIIGLNSAGEEILQKDFDSDQFGVFDFQIPSSVNSPNREEITRFLIYEVSQHPGLKLHLGSFIPLIIKKPKKIVISDFDKTLVDTRYSNLTEVYYSLSKPLSYFPTIDSSVTKLCSLIQDSYQPFILSASPHFYEKAITGWLYKNKIYAALVLLKDYRDLTSFFSGPLTTKDIKKQGFYKLNHLLNIILATGIPDELALLGDGFESDPYIYLTLKSLLNGDDPLTLWRSIRKTPIFSLTPKQDSEFIRKFNKVHELLKRKESHCKIDIYIRAKEDNLEALKKKIFKNSHIERYKNCVEYYIG